MTDSGICVVSHDAGGAEVLASYVARNGLECSLLVEGPARKVFERRLGRPVSNLSLAQAIAQSDLFLTGSSWQSDLEWRVIRAARAQGKRVVTFLDHWEHYRERFIRGGEICLPDILWVGDEKAEQLASEIFPATPVQLVPNPYFEDMREACAKLESSAISRSGRGLRALYVCEPLSEHGLKEYGDERHWGYTEFDALRYFFANQAALGVPLASVVIRPHPAEARDKYDHIANEFGELVRIGGEKSLLQEIVESDVVVGCGSMAMVVGLIAGRRVISSIPPGGRPCALPQSEIESLQVLK